MKKQSYIAIIFAATAIVIAGLSCKTTSQTQAGGANAVQQTAEQELQLPPAVAVMENRYMQYTGGIGYPTPGWRNDGAEFLPPNHRYLVLSNRGDWYLIQVSPDKTLWAPSSCITNSANLSFFMRQTNVTAEMRRRSAELTRIAQDLYKQINDDITARMPAQPTADYTVVIDGTLLNKAVTNAYEALELNPNNMNALNALYDILTMAAFTAAEPEFAGAPVSRADAALYGISVDTENELSWYIKLHDVQPVNASVPESGSAYYLAFLFYEAGLLEAELSAGRADLSESKEYFGIMFDIAQTYQSLAGRAYDRNDINTAQMYSKKECQAWYRMVLNLPPDNPVWNVYHRSSYIGGDIKNCLINCYINATPEIINEIESIFNRDYSNCSTIR